MNLASNLLQQIDNPTLSYNERAQARCRLAKELEEEGNYEAARVALGKLWQIVDSCPVLDDLDQYTAAEVLLRVGCLSGWIGSSKQIEGAPGAAKDLISESIIIFEKLGEKERVAEAHIDLAICYWREGAFDEARVILRDALDHLANSNSEQRARALLNSAEVERAAMRFSDALRILMEAEPVFQTIKSLALKGKFHNLRALVLRNLSDADPHEDYIDRALIEYTAASSYFEQVGHMRFRAAVENNLGFLFFTINRFSEAHEHLNRARRLFGSLTDKVHTAQVDETRARAFLAEGRDGEAEKVVRAAVRTLEEGGEQALLAEAMTTRGVALARLGRHEEARSILQRAIEVAEQAGDNEGAGVAAVTLLEELSEQIGREERLAIYERADQLLSQSQHPGMLVRLRLAARKAVSPQAAPQHKIDERRWPKFVYASDEMAAILKRAHRIATTGQPLLITGETGTGKELLARLVHEWSGRAGEFVVVNCGALVEGLIESELFGHRKGSFTDAVEDHRGVVRQAAGGTLLLDEVAELSPGAQAKLLRVIEQGEIQTIGEPVPEQVDVRIIAATNYDLRQRVAGGSFRNDLFYRLQAFHLEIPPLRARPQDIEALAKYFIGEALKRASKTVVFTPEAVAAMRKLPLEGNARQLRSLIERTLLTASEGAVITVEAVETAGLRRTQRASFANPWEDFSLKEEVHRLEARFIELALKEAKGRVSKAARLLGFKHHESLISLLDTRHRELQGARLPAAPRRRSIIRYDKMKRS